MVKKTINLVVSEVQAVLDKVEEEEALELASEIQLAKRIFVAGEGRSGLMGKAFAMRLMHGGFTVFAVGETITPSIEKGDLLIIISGSGSKGSNYEIGKKAKTIGASVGLITTNCESDIGEICNTVLVLNAATKHRRATEPATIQPLGNQFDQSVHLMLDAIIIYITKQNQSINDEMKQRHTNLE